jgi:hypothetical protein
VGLDAESVRRMFPPALMKSRRSFGVNCGPSPATSQIGALVAEACGFYLWTLEGVLIGGRKLSRPTQTVQLSRSSVIRM